MYSLDNDEQLSTTCWSLCCAGAQKLTEQDVPNVCPSMITLDCTF